jgi:hypothetical protein
MNSGDVNCVCFSFDRNFVATGNEFPILHLIDANIIHKIQTLKGHDSGIWHLFTTTKIRFYLLALTELLKCGKKACK